MTFSQWLEALNYQDIVHGVEIKQINGVYESSFIINNEEYKVTFKPYTMLVASKPGDGFYPSKRIALTENNSFLIELKGPASHSLTNRQVPFTVYKNMLASIKRFIEMKRPAGLIFTGYVMSMDIIYNRFYEKFLKSMYTRIDKENYIRNDVLPKLDYLDSDQADRANQFFSKLKQTKIDRRKEIASVF